MRQETMEKYQRAKARIEAGETVEAAAKAEQISMATYYIAKNLSGDVKGETKSRKPKQPYVQDIPVATTQAHENIQLIIGSPEGIADVIRNLRK